VFKTVHPVIPYLTIGEFGKLMGTSIIQGGPAFRKLEDNQVVTLHLNRYRRLIRMEIREIA